MQVLKGPDGAIVLTLEAREVDEVENALVLGEKRMNSNEVVDENELPELRKARQWLARISLALEDAQARPLHRPQLRQVLD